MAQPNHRQPDAWRNQTMGNPLPPPQPPLPPHRYHLSTTSSDEAAEDAAEQRGEAPVQLEDIVEEVENTVSLSDPILAWFTTWALLMPLPRAHI